MKTLEIPATVKTDALDEATIDAAAGAFASAISEWEQTPHGDKTIPEAIRVAADALFSSLASVGEIPAARREFVLEIDRFETLWRELETSGFHINRASEAWAAWTNALRVQSPPTPRRRQKPCEYLCEAMGWAIPAPGATIPEKELYSLQHSAISRQAAKAGKWYRDGQPDADRVLAQLALPPEKWEDCDVAVDESANLRQAETERKIKARRFRIVERAILAGA